MITPVRLFKCSHFLLDIRARLLFLMTLCCLLISCGGGGSGGESVSNNCGISDCSPQARISPPSITAYAGQIVELDGSLSTPDGSLSYQWRQVGGLAVDIKNADKPIANFVVPTLNEEQSLTFQLVVSKGNSDSPAEMGVIIKPLKVSATRSTPIANVGQTVSLEAGGGDDSGELHYLWEQIDDSGVSVAINNPDAAKASFSTQVVLAEVSARFRVTVTNKFGASAQAETSVDFAVGILPAITAATPAHAAAGEEIKLSGSGFTDALAVNLVREDGVTQIDPQNINIISDHELKFAVPASPAGDYQIEVSNSGGKAYSRLGIRNPVSDASQLAAGHSHYCAISLDSTATCWGENFLGELGDGSVKTSGIPVQVKISKSQLLTDVKSIAAGVFSSCALLADKTVWCWGGNTHGEMGDGTVIQHSYAAQVQGLPKSIVKISGAGYHYCALTTDGDAYCWGLNDNAQIGSFPSSVINPQRVLPDQKLSSIETGLWHTCGIVLSDSSVLCWGANTYGQLGNAANSASDTHVAVLDSESHLKLTGVGAISLGSEHSCALLANGEISCWGRNDSGQLGVGDFSSRNVATKVKGETNGKYFEGAIALSVGRSNHRESDGTGRTCALKNTRNLYCWGDNNYGQIGDFSIVNRAIPTKVKNLENVSTMAIGRAGGCAISTANEIFCWGVNDEAELGRVDARVAGSPVTVENLNGVVAISVGGVGLIESSFSCALATSGIASCWGHNDQGQLGAGTFLDSATPVPVSLPNITAISSGGLHSCAVSGGQVYCWGGNTNKHTIYNTQASRTMQLGSNALDQSPTPLLIDNLASVVDVAAGSEHSCALTLDGNVYCWGESAVEQSGPNAVPTRVALLPSKAVQISAGKESCALLDNNDIYCWHGNVPVKVAMPIGIKALKVVVGFDQSCAVVVGGNVYCWGSNVSGQLGNGSTLQSDIPVEVVGINSAQSISASGLDVYLSVYGYSCALESNNNGSVSCWGANEIDQLGDGSGINQITPVSINGLHGVKQIVSGGSHSCALYHDGYVACWGGFFGGQLGQTPLSPRAVLQ